MSILSEAETIIYGDREKTYGDPGKNLRAIADMWQMYLYHKFGFQGDLSTFDVTAMMRLLKEARLINSPGHRDSLVDICGYAALDERCMEVKYVGEQET